MKELEAKHFLGTVPRTRPQSELQNHAQEFGMGGEQELVQIKML